MPAAWSPKEYEQFRDDRRAPFMDLIDLVQLLLPSASILDVGCGTGELTEWAHHKLKAHRTLGIDASKEMLSAHSRSTHIELKHAHFPKEMPDEKFDLILSNSVFNWIPDHESAIALLWNHLNPGGQIAIQIPSNLDHPFSRCAQRAAEKAPFCEMLQNKKYESPVQDPSWYAELFVKLGAQIQRVGTWYYVQRHNSIEGIVSFARGGLLTWYRERIVHFEDFVSAYADLLKQELGDGPIVFPFRRLLMWARKP